LGSLAKGNQYNFIEGMSCEGGCVGGCYMSVKTQLPKPDQQTERKHGNENKRS
jgi:iron only hydrogenase large subunit-like protein